MSLQVCITFNLQAHTDSTKNNLLIQFQADILGIECIRPKIEETTALGAAYAAGLAVGFWEDLTELRSKWAVDRRFIPDMDESKRADLLNYWKKAITKAKGWIE